MEDASSSVVIEGIPLSCDLKQFRNVLQSSYDVSPVSLSLYGQTDETKSFLAILETLQDAESLLGYGELYHNFGDFECEMKVSAFDKKPSPKDDDYEEYWGNSEPSFAKHETSNAFEDDNSEDVTFVDNYAGYSENWMGKEEIVPSSSVEYEEGNSFQQSHTYDARESNTEYEEPSNSFQQSRTYEESPRDNNIGNSDGSTWLGNEEQIPSSSDSYEAPSTFQHPSYTENQNLQQPSENPNYRTQHGFPGFDEDRSAPQEDSHQIGGFTRQAGKHHDMYGTASYRVTHLTCRPPFPRHQHPRHSQFPPPQRPGDPRFFHNQYPRQHFPGHHRPRHPHLPHHQQRMSQPARYPRQSSCLPTGHRGETDSSNRPRNHHHQEHDFQLKKEQNPRYVNFEDQEFTGVPPTYDRSLRDPPIKQSVSMYDSSAQDSNKANQVVKQEKQVVANSTEFSTKTSLDKFLATLQPSFAQTFQNKAILLVNVPPIINEEKLQLYFQNTKRSGGGQIYRMQTISDGILVIFADAEVSARVVHRTHELYGRKLEIYHKNLPSQYKDRFIIKGVDQGVDEMTIEMYLENCDKINQTTPLTIHQMNISTHMIIYDPTTTSIDNIEAIRANISQSALNGKKVETTSVYQTDCIKVANVSAETSEDFVQMFFSNTKRSGGKNATFVHKTNSQTFAFFANCNVVDDVIERSRTSGLVLNNKQIKVSYCYDYEEQLKSPFHSNQNFPPQINRPTPADFGPTSDKDISKEIQLDDKMRILTSNDWLEKLEREFCKSVSITLDQKKKSLRIEGGKRSSVEMCWRIADDYLKGFVSSALTQEVDQLRRKFIGFCLEDLKRNQNFQEKCREAFNKGKIPVLLYKDKYIKVMHSKRITTKEVSQIVSELIHAKTMIFDVTLLKQAIVTEKWREILTNMANEGILVLPLQGRNVHILSLSDTTPVEQRIKEYINEQTMREEIIDSDLEKALYVEKYYKPTVQSGQVREHDGSLHIKSTSGDFISMRTALLKFIHSLKVRCIKITEAPMKRILRSPGGVELLRKIQHSRQLIILQRLNGKKSPIEALTDATSTMNEHELRYRGILNGRKNISLKVMKGDIASMHCDAIVNATNEKLQLTTAGVSGSILRKGDSSIQAEMNKLLMAKGGNLRTGDAVVSGAGPLPCKHIIHVVGPRWNQNSMPYSDSVRYLKSCIEVCLVKAEEKQLSSIAIPIISCGVFGGDPKTCSSLISDAISKHFQQGKFTSLNEVILIENSNEALLALLIQNAKNISFEMNQSNHSSTFRITQKMVPVSKPSTPSTFKMGNIRIRIIQGEITEQKCDVTLVGSHNFQGPMVNSIINKGGQMIKTELDMQTRRSTPQAAHVAPHGRRNPSPFLQLSGQLLNASLGAKSRPLSNLVGIIHTGSSIINSVQNNGRSTNHPGGNVESVESGELPRLLVTNAHSLPCGRLIFLNLNNCYNYGLLVKQALMKANGLKAKTVSVPLIGAPGLSSKDSAHAFMESIKRFSSQIPDTTIEEIRVVFVNHTFVMHYREEFSKHGFKDADLPSAPSLANIATKPNIKPEETQLPPLPNFELIFCSDEVANINWALQQVSVQCKSKGIVTKRFVSDLLTKAPNETRDLLNDIKEGHKEVEIKFELDRQPSQVIISGIANEVEKVHSILVSSFHQFDKELITNQFVAWKYFDSSGLETNFPLHSNHLLETAYQANKNGRSVLDISFKNGKEATRFLVDFNNMTLQDEAFIKPITREVFHHSANVK